MALGSAHGHRLLPIYTNLRKSQVGLLSTVARPLLLKYRFGFPIVKPYIEAGPSFRWLTNSSFNGTSGSANTNNHGFTLGAGVEIRAVRLVSKTGGKSGTWVRQAAPQDAPRHAKPRPGARVAGRVGSKRKGHP